MIQLEKDLYTIKEVATLLNKTITTIYNAVYSKSSAVKLQIIRKEGKVFIEKEEIKRYLEYLNERDGLIEIDSAYAMKKLNHEIIVIPKLKETQELFLSYARIYFNKMTGSNSYKQSMITHFINFYNKLIRAIQIDIFKLSPDEINDLFLKEEFLKTKEKLLFTRFLNYTFEKKKNYCKKQITRCSKKHFI